MKLITYCKSCDHPNRISDKGVILRTDLHERYGNEIPYQCQECLQHFKVHPNQVYAKVSKMPMLICTLVGLFFIFGGWLLNDAIGANQTWSLAIGCLVIAAGSIASTNTNATSFNKSFVR